MPFTHEQIAKIHQKEASLADALKRDSLTNYYEGYFFVTLNTRGEAPILSTVRGHLGSSGPDAPHCEYTELGEGILKSWKKMSVICKTVKVGPCEAMPEHFHGLIHLLPGNKRHLGSLISGFMAGCTHAYWDLLGIDWHKDRFDKGAYALKVDRDPDHTRSLRGPSLFVRGYNDVEPLTPEAVQVKIEYIRNQAEKRLIKGDRHECFRIFRRQHSNSWTHDVVHLALSSDTFFGRYRDAFERAAASIRSRLSLDTLGHLTLDYIGNRTWLASPNKLPLICHRADAPRFEAQKTAVLDAARKGWIIVSAFISPRERDIKTQLMVEQLPFIEIMDNGFSDRYKPTGKAFYACGENRLVQISCWNYHYEKDPKISREMCLVMNALARVISHRPDDWWKSGELPVPPA